MSPLYTVVAHSRGGELAAFEKRKKASELFLWSPDRQISGLSTTTTLTIRSPPERAAGSAGLNDALLSLACCQTAAECLALSQDVELNPALPQDVCKERLVSNVEHTLPKCWCEMRESLLAWAPLTIIRRPTPDIG